MEGTEVKAGRLEKHGRIAGQFLQIVGKGGGFVTFQFGPVDGDDDENVLVSHKIVS